MFSSYRFCLHTRKKFAGRVKGLKFLGKKNRFFEDSFCKHTQICDNLRTSQHAGKLWTSALRRRRWHRSNRARRAPTVPTLTPKRQIEFKCHLWTLRLQHSGVDNELQVSSYEAKHPASMTSKPFVFIGISTVFDAIASMRPRLLLFISLPLQF